MGRESEVSSRRVAGGTSKGLFAWIVILVATAIVASLGTCVFSQESTVKGEGEASGSVGNGPADTREALYQSYLPPGLAQSAQREASEVVELPSLVQLPGQSQWECPECKTTEVAAHRNVPAFPSDTWRHIVEAEGVGSWRVVIHSPGAVFVRAQLGEELLKMDLVVFFYGEAGVESLEGPFSSSDLDRTGRWGPAIEGEYLYIEVINGSSTLPPLLTIPQISHGYVGIPPLEKLGTCYRDVTCYSAWSDPSRAVARIYFEQGGGGYICTGCLLNDTDTATQRFWFLTAQHCISSDAVADTVIAYFDYRTSTCNGAAPSLAGSNQAYGSDYVVGSATSDFTLLELDQNPPGTQCFMGWTTADLSAGQDIVTVHHPAGSWMRITFGDESGSSGNFWRVIYTLSSTEGGSSGAPLFDVVGQYVRGQLYGGTALCTDMSGYDRFGKFGVSWGLGLSTYLDNSPTAPDLMDDGESFRSFSPTTMTQGQAGQTFQIHCDVRNRGDASSGPFVVKFYASTNTTITSSDWYLGQVSMSGITAGDWADCDWYGTFPTGIPVGSYWIGWIIDANTQVTESDESNNAAYKEGYQLTVIVPDPALCRNPGTLDFGTTSFSKSFEVWNCGGGTLNYSISDDQAWIGLSPASGSSTGEHDVVTVTVNRSGVPVGQYSGTVTIDPDYGLNQSVAVEMDVAPDPTPATFRVQRDGTVGSDGAFYAASFLTGAADVAEWAVVSDLVEPGAVLELDAAHPGAYRLSQGPCSLLVGGVVSSCAGLVLGETEDTGTKAVLALSGIVPVKVTSEGGAIQPGDLLVTSSTPGHAMRWAGSSLCPCSLVGKALASMTEETGMILVLLTAH